MMKKPLSVLIIALCIALAAASFASAEQAIGNVEIKCAMGYNDVLTYLRSVPVNIEVTNNGNDADGLLQVEIMRSNATYDNYEMPLFVASGGTARVSIPVELTYKQKEYTVRWLVNGKTAAEQTFKPGTTLDPATIIIGVLSDSARSLSQFDITQTDDPLTRMEYWRTIPISASELPDSSEGMGFFDMLMVDGADLSALNDAQQIALERWIEDGGVIIIGGGAQAAAAFPYFSKYTGITAGALTASQSVSQELIEQLKSAEEPAVGLSRIVALNGASGRKIGSATLLADITNVGNGRIITCAFSLSDEPLAKWQGRFALWQRLLLANESALYSRMVGIRSTNNRYNYINNNYVDGAIASLIKIPNKQNAVLPVILLGVFVVLAGFGGYLLLKRFDKREWLWAVIPALSVVVSLCMWLLSGSIGIMNPAAAYYTVVRMDSDGTTESFTGVTATRAAAGRIRISADEGTIDPAPGISYYDSAYGEEENSNQKKLRFTYGCGSEKSIEMPNDVTWGEISFGVDGVPVRDCVLSGECSLDGDGLLFTIKNEGGVTFEPGLIMTDYGFVSVDELAPGKTITARLAPSADPNVTLNGSSDIDGVLLTDADRNRYTYYDFINAYNTSSRKKNKDISFSLRSTMLNNALSSRRSYSNAGLMRYYGFSDELAQLNLSIDGEKVERTNHYDMIELDIKYNPIGTDGTVKFLNGSFPSYEADADSQGKPSLGVKISDAYRYYRLENEPVFGFDTTILPQNFKLTGFRLFATYSYYSYKVSLYNIVTGKWDNVIKWDFDQASGKGQEQITVTTLDGYIDEDGMLYARFEKVGSIDNYAEIGAPVLTMDGRVE